MLIILRVETKNNVIAYNRYVMIKKSEYVSEWMYTFSQ